MIDAALSADNLRFFKGADDAAVCSVTSNGFSIVADERLRFFEGAMMPV